jgi:hypothetical protein
MVQRDAPTDQQITPVEDSLRKIPDDVRAAVEKWVRDQASDFEKQVRDYLAEASSPRQADELRLIQEEIAHARTQLDAKGAEEARPLLDMARLHFVRLLAKEQAGAIDPASPPFFVSPAAWATTAARLKEMLDQAQHTDDPETASQLFNRAYASHLDARASALQQHVKDQQTLIEKNPNFTDADKAQQKQAVSLPLERLVAMRDHSVAGRLREAAAVLKEIEDAIEVAIKRLPHRGQQQGGAASAAASTPLVVQPSAPPGPGALPGAFTPYESRGQGSARDALERGEKLFLLAGALIALVLGFKVLYADNATWGGLTDSLTAFLWGLGVTHTSGAAFEGFSSLFTKVSK